MFAASFLLLRRVILRGAGRYWSTFKFLSISDFFILPVVANMKALHSWELKGEERVVTDDLSTKKTGSAWFAMRESMNSCY